ncbi:MAG TPA: hypothetical protein VLV78_11580 [Thermoanaerobaculia bacterium]|nr:hypothetical protein [Thermoanaerobaculia bacterium]
MRRALTVAITVFLGLTIPVIAAEVGQAPDRPTPAPARIRFESELRTANGTPRVGPLRISISLYADRKSKDALWVEEQTITPDKDGQYAINIGATEESGIPDNVFASGTARWIGVAVVGEDEQPRVMVISVPYAVKAREAETIGGKSVSDFVLQSDLKDKIRSAIVASTIPTVTTQIGGPLTSLMSLGIGRKQTNLSVIGTAAGDFTHQALTGFTIGVAGRTSSIWTGPNAASGATGVQGEVLSTNPGGYSAGVRGVNASTSGSGIGVVGYQGGSGWGVYGETPSGFGVFGLTTDGTAASTGVRGETFSANGIGVEAKFSGPGIGVALQVDNGAIQVAGVNKAAFVHTATVANKLDANGTDIDNPLCNGDPNAILIVTQKLNPTGVVYNNNSVGAFYNSVRSRWTIFNENSLNAIPTNAQFFVLVIKQ